MTGDRIEARAYVELDAAPTFTPGSFSISTSRELDRLDQVSAAARERRTYRVLLERYEAACNLERVAAINTCLVDSGRLRVDDWMAVSAAAARYDRANQAYRVAATRVRVRDE